MRETQLKDLGTKCLKEDLWAFITAWLITKQKGLLTCGVSIRHISFFKESLFPFVFPQFNSDFISPPSHLLQKYFYVHSKVREDNTIIWLIDPGSITADSKIIVYLNVTYIHVFPLILVGLQSSFCIVIVWSHDENLCISLSMVLHFIPFQSVFNRSYCD